MSHKNVAVYIEQHEGNIAEVSLELLGKARDLADELKVDVYAYLPGKSVENLAKTCYQYGADTVYIAEHKELDKYRTMPYTKAVIEMINQDKPEILLFGATRVGRDIAPRVASTVKAGLTADCTHLKFGDYTEPKSKQVYNELLYQIRPAFGGNIIATIINPENHPQMATVREGVMRLKEADTKRTGTLTKCDVSFDKVDLAVEVLSQTRKELSVDLKGANIIVAGGMGVGSKANFDKLHELAKVLGGEVAASRAAVDQGWIGKEHQVGQTGVTVRPKLYVACGISGSVQHKAGMCESLKIIAVNNDPDAPIFVDAHVRIVGDLNDVLPKLIEAYKHNNTKSGE